MSASVGMEISRLRVVLVALAQKHAINIKQNVNGTRTSLSKSCFSEDYERKLHQLLDSLPTEVYFEHIDRDSLWDGIADLLKSAETKFKPSENNIYVSSYSIPNTLQFQDRNLEIEWEILDTGNEEQVPLVYDVLSAIFYRTDSLGRQRHFHELVDFYYKSLEQSLQQHHLEISSVLPMDVYHNQIKKLSPFSKLSVLNIYCSREADGQRNTLLKEAISEMEECLLYCEHLLREDCYKILSTALSTTNYEFVKFKIIPVKERSGVLGDYLKLIISIKINTADEELNFFVKCLPTSFKGARDMALRVFKKEQFCYETFLSSLEQVGCEYITNFAPKCYFVRSNDVIVLEDLTIQGFAVKNMFVSPVEYKWLTLAVKQLAKLHACSVVLEEKMSEQIGRTFRCDEEFGEYLEEELYTDIDEYESMISCGFREAIRFLDKFPDIPKRITLEEFKHRMKRSINAVYEDIKKSSHVRNVVNHGDTWCNNFMFKTDEKNEPINCFLIDFQMIRFCPPALDLLFFIYISTDRKTRERYLTQLVDDYYMEFKNILSSFNIDMEEMYNYENFLDMCEHAKLSALCMTFQYLQIQTFPKEKWNLLLEDEDKSQHFMTKDRSKAFAEIEKENPFWIRIRENIEEIYDIFVGGH